MEACSQFNSKGRDPWEQLFCLGDVGWNSSHGAGNPRDFPQVCGASAGGCLGLSLQQGSRSVAQDCKRMTVEDTSLLRPSVGAGTVLPLSQPMSQASPDARTREKSFSS